mgnify:CR=1 FL=1
MSIETLSRSISRRFSGLCQQDLGKALNPATVLRSGDQRALVCPTWVRSSLRR